MEQFIAELVKWTVAAGPFAAIVFLVLWWLERDERKDAQKSLEAERSANTKNYVTMVEKFLTSTGETLAAVRTLTELMRGGRNVP